MKCYDKALESNPSDYIAWFAKGISLRKLRRYEEAIECYDIVLENNPYDYAVWYAKGYALDELERYEEAIECYDKALEINPGYDDANTAKNISLRKLRRYEAIRKCYNRLVLKSETNKTTKASYCLKSSLPQNSMFIFSLKPLIEKNCKKEN